MIITLVTLLVVEMAIKKNLRRSDRKSVSMQAELSHGSQSDACNVLNLSTGGSKIEIAQILEQDEQVALTVGGSKKISGHIAWSQTPYYGLRFDDGADDVAETLMAIATYGEK